ncbi:hypothetical protein JCM10207_006218 [Rhodosporidiobolus poonsookiae]
MLIQSLLAFAAASLAVAQSSASASSSGGGTIGGGSVSVVPSCALDCVIQSLPGTECESYGVGNLTCICTSSTFQLAYYTCQQSTCSQTDLTTAQLYGAQQCQNNGTPININETPSGYTGPTSAASGSTAPGPSVTITQTYPTSASEGDGAALTDTTGASAPLATTASTPAPSATTGGGNGAGRTTVAAAAALLAAGAAVVVGVW